MAFRTFLLFFVVFLTTFVVSSGARNVGYLHFASDNTATMYLNGVKVGSIHDWHYFSTIGMPLSKGDVISIVAKDDGVLYGAIADLQWKGRHYVTKVGQGPWRVCKASSINSKAWQKPGFSSCKWSYPSAATVTPPGPGTAFLFPYRSEAQYVWAPGATVSDTIFMRLVVGGERC